MGRSTTGADALSEAEVRARVVDDLVDTFGAMDGPVLVVHELGLGRGSARADLVVIHADAQGQLLGELDAAGGAYHKAGTRSRAGGLDLDFEHYPVPLWFEEGDAVYLLLARDRSEGETAVAS